MYKAILLDVFGTLVVDDDSPYVSQLADLAGVPAASVAQVWESHLWAAADGAHGVGFRTLADLESASLALTAAHFGFVLPPRPVPPAALFPDAAPFLAALSVPVCLVSDADRNHLVGLLASLGVTVDHVVTSEDARAYKPRPEPFEMALSLLGLTAAEVIHVGDSPASDLIGAQELGIATAFVDRSGCAVLPPGVRPTVTVNRLTDLLPL
ncbi:HAD family hydrolase [Actinoplanes sp. LDG1-06]|uniref:HAD family hydrolase n=1 Tax=Paractinoplanes ovalisporus TaxID=2810368 RepID=A0ABS2A8G4_9ACTN|nr:HAD family hydrolase [Actinoplanes ovalisporus]MBM2616122.1 HAD family hydrolase [Actinoplanes ovalisporus]